MSYILAQFLSALGGQVLAARNSDEKDTGWMQILVFVILSVFYAVGSIVKARANKAAPKGKEQTPRKPARKPTERTRDLQKQLLKQFRRPAGPTPRSQPRPQITKPQVAKPQVQPKLEEIPELTAETVKKLEGKRVAAPAEIARTEYLSEILSDYENPESLRRAILHYEILGKPISLREPSEHVIGL